GGRGIIEFFHPIFPLPQKLCFGAARREEFYHPEERRKQKPPPAPPPPPPPPPTSHLPTTPPPPPPPSPPTHTHPTTPPIRRLRRGPLFSIAIAGMISADTSAASFDTAQPEEPRRWSLSRWLAPFAVGLALLSAFLTFVVLTGLTSIEPTPEVVRSFLLINAG